MEGDFSRGDAPDRERGERYRRVLLQQGRVLLDSDVNAAVDALAEGTRQSVRDLGCAAGSPDLGFLVTPGRLLRVFTDPRDVSVVAGTAAVALDFRHRFHDRLPSLRLTADVGGTARVRIALRQPFDGRFGDLVVWARSETSLTLDINGVTHALGPVSPDDWQPVRLPAALADGDTAVELALAAGDQLWLALLEQFTEAGASDREVFWVAAGHYHVDGLIAERPVDRAFPDGDFPTEAGFWPDSPSGPPPLDGLTLPPGASAGERFVAFLEVRERHLTAVEAPGIREQALGGGVETTTRTRVLGQVKLATTSGLAPEDGEAAAQARAAFDSVGGDGSLSVVEDPGAGDAGICDLPALAGYKGTDNRLYRFEVHRGGDLAELRLKWSRDNASDLFAARLDESGNLRFAAGTPLTDGDYVEVLSDVVDLGDARLAEVSATGFGPPLRATGQLALLAEVALEGSTNEVVFRLVDIFDATLPVALDDRYGDLGADDNRLKLRRWHGLLEPQQIAIDTGQPLSPGPHAIEDGIEITLSASARYDPGTWWHYEARAQSGSAAGSRPTSPHGPERRFAPLALLEFQGDTQPLRLIAWLDTRFPRLCEIEADDVSFHGARVGSPSETVQEALEELFAQPVLQASCGELIVRPGDDLQTVLDAIPDDGDARICLHPATWNLVRTVRVRNKGDLIISGAGPATRIAIDTAEAALVFENCRSVRLSDLAVHSDRLVPAEEHINGVVSFVDCGTSEAGGVVALRDVQVMAPAGDVGRRRSGILVRTAVESSPLPLPEVRIENCRVTVGPWQVGILVVDAARTDIIGNTVVSPEGELDLAELLDDDRIAAWLGRRFIDSVVIGETEEANDELLVGSSEVVVSGSPDSLGRPRIIVMLDAWGRQFITFSTDPQLQPSVWEDVLRANPIRADARSPEAWIHANIRRFRAALVRDLVRGDAGVTIPSAHRGLLHSVLRPTDADVAAGGQGIVVGGRRAEHLGAVPAIGGDARFVNPGPRAPVVRIVDNRIEGFMQGVRVGLSDRDRRDHRLRVYRAHIAQNTVLLRLPSFARDPHGIFLGNAQSADVEGNVVEILFPEPRSWDDAPFVCDGIRLFGSYGPLLQVRRNHVTGPTMGIRAHILNWDAAGFPGVAWQVEHNAYVGFGEIGGIFH